jgi:L-aspartate oxidase
LTFALGVADHGRVALVTKDQSSESNSSYAQGGVATVWSAEDSFDSHAEDTLVAGPGSVTPTWCRWSCGRGPTGSAT